MKPESPTALAAAGMLALLLSPAAKATINTSCDAYSEQDAMMWVRHVDTGDREMLDVTLRVPDRQRGLTQRVHNVFVGTETVGQIRLSDRAGGHTSGGLSLDSAGGYNGAMNLPVNWSGAGAGTLVRVGQLACQLQ